MIIPSPNAGSGVGRVKALMPIQALFIDAAAFSRLSADCVELRPACMRVRVWALHQKLFFGIRRAAAVQRGCTGLQKCSAPMSAAVDAATTNGKGGNGKAVESMNGGISDEAWEAREARLLDKLSHLIDLKLKQAVQAIAAKAAAGAPESTSPQRV